MSLLEVKGLNIEYRTRKGRVKAVEGVSFTLDRGESLGFVGESGCGKTTIGMALMGLLPPNGGITSGSILFDGMELVNMSEEQIREIRWKRISMIFQSAMNALNPVHRVGDQIIEAILTHYPDMKKEEAIERVKELFRLVGIPESRISDYPHQYSGGMRQRAIIAMALSCYPSLIIADEPTTALDVIVQHQILEEIKRLQKELNLSIIFISHDISIVGDVCNKIAVMYAGQMVEYGTSQNVLLNPIHPYTRALLSSFPTLDESRKLESIPGETCNLISPPQGCRFCDRCPLAERACKHERPQWLRISPEHLVSCYQCEG